MRYIKEISVIIKSLVKGGELVVRLNLRKAERKSVQ